MKRKLVDVYCIDWIMLMFTPLDIDSKVLGLSHDHLYWICSWYNTSIKDFDRVSGVSGVRTWNLRIWIGFLEVLGIELKIWRFIFWLLNSVLASRIGLEVIMFWLLEESMIVLGIRLFILYYSGVYLDRAHFSAWPDRTCWLMEIGN